MAEAKHTCCQGIFKDYHTHACGKGAKYERGGKWYCGTHDPVAIKAKNDARNAVWNAQMVARKAAREAESNAAEAQRLNAERYLWLRDLHCNSLTLSRDDDHACNYMTAKEWIEDRHAQDFDNVPIEEVEAMKASNTIWRLQVYPFTPIGFWTTHGATMDSAIDAAMTEEAAKGKAL